MDAGVGGKGWVLVQAKKSQRKEKKEKRKKLKEVDAE